MIINYTVAGQHIVGEGFVIGYGLINADGSITLMHYGEGDSVLQAIMGVFFQGSLEAGAWWEVQEEIEEEVQGN
jgi:hypothetical protein